MEELANNALIPRFLPIMKHDPCDHRFYLNLFMGQMTDASSSLCLKLCSTDVDMCIHSNKRGHATALEAASEAARLRGC